MTRKKSNLNRWYICVNGHLTTNADVVVESFYTKFGCPKCGYPLKLKW